ncbi:MAG: FAD binding domain-containing protein [Myxococcota bacterium]
MNRFSYLRAGSLAEAAEALRRPSSMLKAGGTDVVDRLKERLEAPEVLVSIGGIKSASAIELRPDGGVSIGALCTIAAIADHPGLRAQFPALTEAAASLATPNIRNVATLGGNLGQRPRCPYFRAEHFHCRRKGGSECFAIHGEHVLHAIWDNKMCAAVSAPSTGAPLVALEAEAVIIAYQKPARRVKLEELFMPSGENLHRELRLAPGELIERVDIPGPKRANAYRRAMSKESFDWPMVEVAVALRRGSTGLIEAARLVLGSVAMTPRRAKEAEAALIGKAPSPALFAKAAALVTQGATPLENNGYKLGIAVSLSERALLAAAEMKS